MKKLWIILLCAVMVLTATACGAAKPAEEKEKKAADYEEFTKLGMTFRLPSGTEEEKESADEYYYRNGDLFVMLGYDSDTQFNDASIEAYKESFAADGIPGKTHSCKVDKHDGYWFDITDYTDDGYTATVTVFNVSVGCIEFVMTAKSADKDDYADINDELLDTIKISDTYWDAVADQPDYYVDGYTAVTEECTIKITDYKVLKPGEGANAYGSDNVICFEYDITNTSGEQMTPAVEWPSVMEVVQDNSDDTVNTLDPAVVMGDKYDDVSLQEIKADGTVHCAHYYTLSDTSTPVTINVRNGLMGEDLGTMTFELK